MSVNSRKKEPIYLAGILMSEKPFIVAILLVALAICVGIPWLVVAGKPATSVYLVRAWTAGLIAVGVSSALLILLFSKRLKRVLRKLEPMLLALSTAKRIGLGQPVIPEGRDEIGRIRARDPENEIRQVLCRQGFRELLSLWNQVNTVATFHGMQSVWDLTHYSGLRREYLVPIEQFIFGEEALKKSLARQRFCILDDGSGCCFRSHRRQMDSH